MENSLTELKALRADVEALKNSITQIQHIDADLKEVLRNYLISTIITKDQDRRNSLKKFIYELTNKFTPDLVYYLLETSKGIPLEVVYHNISMESDIPVKNYHQ